VPTPLAPSRYATGFCPCIIHVRQTAETAICLGSTAIAAHAADPDSDDGPIVDPDRRLARPGVVRRLAAVWKRLLLGQQGWHSAATALR